MKILSKYKDYYDYLQGIWGMDEKLVLDRTDYTPTPDYTSNYPITSPIVSLIRFYICDMVVEGVYYQKKAWEQGEFLFGADIAEVLKDKVEPEDDSHKRWRDYSKYYYIDLDTKPKFGISWFRVLKHPVHFFDLEHEPTGFYQEKKEVKCPNEILNCPILIENLPVEKKYDVSKCTRFPVMRDYNLHKVYSAQDMWLMLGEWLGREKVIPNNQTNNEKILSNGFDLKSSFRNPIK
jgi:hypothetical protein